MRNKRVKKGGLRLSRYPRLMHQTFHLDTRTLLITGITVATILIGVLFGLARRQEGMQALRLWGWTMLAFETGLGLVTLRGLLPDALSILLADALLFAAALLAMRSVRSFEGRPAPDPQGWLIAGAGCLLAGYYVVVAPHETARIVAFSSVFALLLARVSIHLFRSLPDFDRPPQAFTATVLALFAALSAVRAAATLLHLEPVDDILAPNHLQSLSVLAQMAVMLAATLGMLWMEIHRLQSRLFALATVDGLTGILNRRALMDAARREISRCARSGEPLGVAMLDLDHFKRINDRYGHPVGDHVLRAFADTLRGVVRPHDILGRYGGEEFVLVMPAAGLDAAVAVAERCRQAIEALNLELDGNSIRFTVSAGVAVYKADGEDIKTLIAAADAALYRAKAGGRNRVVAAVGSSGAIC